VVAECFSLPAAPSRWGRVGVLTALLLGACVLATACTVDGPLCSDLSESIEAREQALSRSCEVDSDCIVIETTPDRYVAVSEVPNDPELDAAITSWTEAECPRAQEPLPAVFGAGCFVAIAPDTGRRRGQCALTLDGEMVDIDEPGFELPPGVGCNCETQDDCERSELCADDCLCKPACVTACEHVDACGETAVADAGLGADLETCIAVCEANLFDETLLTEELPCIAEASCNAVRACLAQ